MHKKLLSPKTAKTHSRFHFPDVEAQPPKPIADPQLQVALSQLQKLLSSEIATRELQYAEVMGRIRHLDQTKKAKLPVKSELRGIGRLGSPVKNPTAARNEPDASEECRNLLAAIRDERQADRNNSQAKIQEIQKQLQKMSDKINFTEAVEMNVCHLTAKLNDLQRHLLANVQQSKQQERAKQMDLSREHQQYSKKLMQIESQVALIQDSIVSNSHLIAQSHKQFIAETISQAENQLQQWLSSSMKAQNQLQQMYINEVSRNLNQRLDGLQKCNYDCMQIVARMEKTALRSFQTLESRVKMASDNIIETRETIEENFFGPDYRSKERFDSEISLDCTQESHHARRGPEQEERIGFVENRVSSLQRRMDSVCNFYLGRPFGKACEPDQSG